MAWPYLTFKEAVAEYESRFKITIVDSSGRSSTPSGIRYKTVMFGLPVGEEKSLGGYWLKGMLAYLPLPESGMMPETLHWSERPVILEIGYKHIGIRSIWAFSTVPIPEPEPEQPVPPYGIFLP